MRGHVRLASVAAMALAVAAPALAAAPTLRMIARNPLTVAGAGFKAGEKVVVTANRRGTRRAVATSAGRFRVRFAVTAGTSCEALSVRAVGSRGTRATLVVSRPAGCGVTPPAPPTTPQPPSDPGYPGGA